MSKDRNSVFAKVLENCGNYFCFACKDLLSGIQDFNDQTFIDYLRNFSFNDSRLQTCLFACGNVGAARPLESFHFLMESYPDIDINSRVEPSSRIPSGGSNFLYLLGNIKWDNKYIRAAVKYTIIYIITKFCRFITMQASKTMKQKEATDLIEKMLEFIDKKSDSFHDPMLLLVIDELKMAISYTSINAKAKTFDIVKSVFSRLHQESPEHTTLLLKLFSEVIFKFEDESQVNQLLSSIVKYYNGKDQTSEAAAACILNIIGQACVLFPKYRSSDDIVNYYDRATGFNDQFSYELQSLILAFTNNKSIKKGIKKFAQKCYSDISDKDVKCSTYILKALTRFMYGKNYIPRSVQLLDNEQYSWHASENEYKEYLDIIEILKKNIKFVSKASVESQSEFILQIACNDINSFIDNVIKKINKDEVISDSFEESILVSLSTILAVNTNFINNCKIEKSEVEKVTLKIKEEGFEMCKKLFKSDKAKENDKSLNIYIVPSFTQALNTICSPMKHSISDVHTILSIPIFISSVDQEFPKTRYLSAFLNKWKKANPIFEEIPKSFLDENKDHKRSQISLKGHVLVNEYSNLIKSMEDNKVMVAALNLAPLILTPSNSSKIIKCVCSKVINKEAAVGAIAVRSLQAAIHVNQDNATKIINQLYSYLYDKISTINPDSIYCIVSALKSILEATAFERIPLSKANYKHIFFIISLGMISSCYITRTAALDASKIIQNPIVNNFFDIIDDVTSERGKELLFSVLCPGIEDLDDIESIKFYNFARSKVSYLYTFYIQGFANSLINNKFEDEIELSSSIPSDSSAELIMPQNTLVDYKDVIDSSKEVIEELREYFIQLLTYSKNFEEEDPILIIYMISFIFATWKDGNSKEKDNDIDKQKKHGIVHFVKKLCNLKIKGVEEWCAAATSSISPSFFSERLVEHLPPRTFALYLLRCSKEPDFIDNHCCVNNEAFKQGYLKVMKSFFELKFISTEATFSIDSSNSNQNHYQTALYAFGKAITTIFSVFAKNQTRCLLGCNGIFPRNSISQPMVDPVLTSNESYAFWFNLSSEDKFYFSIPCQTAYAELVKIMYIPDIWFELVTNNIEKIVEHTPEIAITLFTHYSGVLMPIYIRNAQSSYPFFAGIAKQFCTSENFIEEWKSKIASVPTVDLYEREESTKNKEKNGEDTSPETLEKNIVMKTMVAAKRFSDLILRNIGTLLAIATSYLIGRDVFQRMTAFDFIYVTSLSTHLVYSNNVNETVSLSTELLSVKETFLTNFEQFFANTASKVICSLADHLPFLSEQFCSGIFAVESIKGGKRKESEENEFMNELEATESRPLSVSVKKTKAPRSNAPVRNNRSKLIIPLPPNPNQSKYQGNNNGLNQGGIREVSLTGIAQYSQMKNFNYDNFNTNTNYGNFNNGNSNFVAKKTASTQIPISNQSSSLAMIPVVSIDPQNKNDLVLSSFDNNSKEISRYVASFIVPWVKRIRFVPERLHVFEGCLPSYRMFSMYTFIQSIVRLKSLLPITPPITDILYPTYKAAGPLFLIVLTDLYFKMPDLQENVVAMITYAYTINSRHVMQYFLSFLNIRYWYYQQIQISKLNQAFDFRLFLQDMQVSGESDDDKDQEVIIDYVSVINFVLKMFITFMKENQVQILPYKNKIITFCALAFREFAQPAQEIFHLFLSLKPPGAIKTEKSINYIGPYTYDAIVEIFKESISSSVISLIKPSLYSSSPSSLSTAVATGIFNSGASYIPDESNEKNDELENEINTNIQLGSQLNLAESQSNLQNFLAVKNKTAVINAFSKKNISHYLIEWGLICGDSFIASLALKLFISLDFKASEAEVNYALDSIYLIYMMVKDAATTRNTHGRQTLLKLADSDAKPDYANAYNHIQYLCLLCQNVQSNPSADLVNRILLTSFALLLLPEPGKFIKDLTKAKPEPTITAALRNIYIYRDFLPNFHPEKLIEMRLDSTRSFVKDNNNENDMQSSTKDGDNKHSSNDSTPFQGFTYYLFVSSLNEDSLRLGSSIIIYLLQKKLTFLLNGNDQEPIFTYYAIAPFIFADKSTHNSEDEIVDKELKEAYLGVANQQSEEALENFHKVIVKNNINKNKKKDAVNACFERLFNFYRTIVRIGSILEVKAALILASLIIKDHLLASSSQVLGELSREIIQKRDHELKECVNEFYKLLVIQYGGQISTQKKTISAKDMPDLFGSIKEEDALEWRPSELLTTLRTSIDTGVSTDSDDDDNKDDDEKDNDNDKENKYDISEQSRNKQSDSSDSDDSDEEFIIDNYDVIGDDNIGKRDSDDNYVDVFKKPKFYPPIFLTDYALFISEFMNNLLPVVEQVKVQPFTRWDTEIFSEEQAAEKTNKGNPNENSFAACFDDELEGDEKLALTKNDKKIRKVARELQKVLNDKFKHKSKENRLAHAINPVHSSAQFCVVDSDLFCPTLEMVDRICPTDGSKKDDLPSIIQ